MDKVRCDSDVPSPRNLDALADFLVDAGIDRITCANWAMNDEDARAINTVLSDIGVILLSLTEYRFSGFFWGPPPSHFSLLCCQSQK